jgi:hypothetical protein
MTPPPNGGTDPKHIEGVGTVCLLRGGWRWTGARGIERERLHLPFPHRVAIGLLLHLRRSYPPKLAPSPYSFFKGTRRHDSHRRRRRGKRSKREHTTHEGDETTHDGGRDNSCHLLPMVGPTQSIEKALALSACCESVGAGKDQGVERERLHHPFPTGYRVVASP